MFKQSAFRPFVPYFAAASLWANAAHGQADPSPSHASTAAETAAVAPAAPVSAEFERGLTALSAGQHRAAIEAFSAAYASDGNPAALMNLGIAYTNQGLLNHAVEALTRYIERANPSRDAQSIALVQSELERIRSTNGVVVLHFSPDNAAIQVDGVVLSPLNGELVVAPGQRRFVVFADGYVNYDQKMAVAAGRFSLDVTLTPISAAKVELPAPSPAPVADKKTMISDAESVDEPEADDPMNCALSSVCVGPVLALIGPPNLFGGGLHFRLGEYFGAGVDYQAMPSISLDPVSVSASLFSVNARVYPFGGAFFLGGGFGYQAVRGEVANSDVTVAANASFPAAMASIGFMGRDGFVMGMDLGLLFPLGRTRVEVEEMTVHRDLNGLEIPESEVEEARAKVESQVNQIVDALPMIVQLNLLRIGYLF